jgi:predicted metal-dependent hydrolase
MTLMVGERVVPLQYVRNRRARRYVLRVRSDGSVRVTAPAFGSFAAAQRFALSQISWLEGALERVAARPKAPTAWMVGSKIHLGGELVEILASADHTSHVQVGCESIEIPNLESDLRGHIEAHLWNRSAQVFPRRVMELAQRCGLIVKRVSVRNQKRRWGSCSSKGTISLNWRLIQTPPFVQDYIILHELMHLREMNHSARFWKLVSEVCPAYKEAEGWLKAHRELFG